MNGLDEMALAHWAAERKIGLKLARAIFEIADGDDDAQRIFERPTPCEVMYVALAAACDTTLPN